MKSLAAKMPSYPNLRFRCVSGSWDSPDFYFLFMKGNQGGPNLSFASVD